MTPRRPIDPGLVREAFTLPLILLTVTLAGGLRIAASGALTFTPPPLMALVLAVMLLGTLHRGGALAPDALIAPHRGALANLNGGVVLVTLLTAAAQTLNTLTPEAGLLAFSYNLVLIVLLANTLVARPDRSRLLGSLMIVLGAAFVVKYVVLASLYAPNGGLTRRVVLALLEGVSLGGLAYEPPGPATGYVAFVTTLLFLTGLALLPSRRPLLSVSLAMATTTPVDVLAPPPARHPDDR